MGVTDAAIDKIRDLIVTGQLQPGQRLPPEQELAAQLGLSRNSLREAVRALTQAHVLDVRRGDGTYVTSLEPSLLLGGLGFAVDLMQDRTLLEVFEVRRLLEPAATALAATRIDAAQLTQVRTWLDRMRHAPDVEQLLHCDVEFHTAIVASTGNASLVSLLQGLSTRTLRARIWRGISDDRVLVWSLAQHQRIVDSLEARDAALAQAAATVHIAASEDWLRRVVAEGREVPEDPLAAAPARPQLPLCGTCRATAVGTF